MMMRAEREEDEEEVEKGTREKRENDRHMKRERGR